MTPGEITLVPRPSPLTTDLRGWLQTFVRSTFFAPFEDAKADQYITEVENTCRPDAYWSVENPGMGLKPVEEAAAAARGASTHGWEVMYVRLRGVAYRPVDR